MRWSRRAGRPSAAGPDHRLLCPDQGTSRPLDRDRRVGAQARCLFWCLLNRGEDYAFAQPSLTKKKMRRLELRAGAPALPGRPPRLVDQRRDPKAERELALQAQRAYERTVNDWQQTKGASATAGRASSGSSKEQVARQTTRP